MKKSGHISKIEFNGLKGDGDGTFQQGGTFQRGKTDKIVGPQGDQKSGLKGGRKK